MIVQSWTSLIKRRLDFDVHFLDDVDIDRVVPQVRDILLAMKNTILFLGVRFVSFQAPIHIGSTPRGVAKPFKTIIIIMPLSYPQRIWGGEIMYDKLSCSGRQQIIFVGPSLM